MPFKNSKYLNSITIQSVDNAISSVNKLPNIRITYFWHSPSASRIFSQNCFSMVNQAINEPNSALFTVTSDKLLYFNQIFTSFL